MSNFIIRIVLEGIAKYREGKKWKTRYCLLALSPHNSDAMHLYVIKNHADFTAYRKDHMEDVAVPSNSTGYKLNLPVQRADGMPESSDSINTPTSDSIPHSCGSDLARPLMNTATQSCVAATQATGLGLSAATALAGRLNAPSPVLDEITGFESGCHMDKESNIIVLIGNSAVYTIALQGTDEMFRWADAMRYYMIDYRFRVTLRKSNDSSKLTPGTQGTLHVQRWRICLVGEPSAGCKLIASWRLDSIDNAYTQPITAVTSGIGDGSGHVELETGVHRVSLGSLGLSGGTSVASGQSKTRYLCILEANQTAGKGRGTYSFEVDSSTVSALSAELAKFMARQYLPPTSLLLSMAPDCICCQSTATMSTTTTTNATGYNTTLSTMSSMACQPSHSVLGLDPSLQHIAPGLLPSSSSTESYVNRHSLSSAAAAQTTSGLPHSSSSSHVLRSFPLAMPNVPYPEVSNTSGSATSQEPFGRSVPAMSSSMRDGGHGHGPMASTSLPPLGLLSEVQDGFETDFSSTISAGIIHGEPTKFVPSKTRQPTAYCDPSLSNAYTNVMPSDCVTCSSGSLSAIRQPYGHLLALSSSFGRNAPTTTGGWDDLEELHSSNEEKPLARVAHGLIIPKIPANHSGTRVQASSPSNRLCRDTVTCTTALPAGPLRKPVEQFNTGSYVNHQGLLDTCSVPISHQQSQQQQEATCRHSHRRRTRPSRTSQHKTPTPANQLISSLPTTDQLIGSGHAGVSRDTTCMSCPNTALLTQHGVFMADEDLWDPEPVPVPKTPCPDDADTTDKSRVPNSLKQPSDSRYVYITKPATTNVSPQVKNGTNTRPACPLCMEYQVYRRRYRQYRPCSCMIYTNRSLSADTVNFFNVHDTAVKRDALLSCPDDGSSAKTTQLDEMGQNPPVPTTAVSSSSASFPLSLDISSTGLLKTSAAQQHQIPKVLCGTRLKQLPRLFHRKQSKSHDNLQFQCGGFTDPNTSTSLLPTQTDAATLIELPCRGGTRLSADTRRPITADEYSLSYVDESMSFGDDDLMSPLQAERQSATATTTARQPHGSHSLLVNCPRHGSRHYGSWFEVCHASIHYPLCEHCYRKARKARPFSAVAATTSNVISVKSSRPVITGSIPTDATTTTATSHGFSMASTLRNLMTNSRPKPRTRRFAFTKAPSTTTCATTALTPLSLSSKRKTPHQTTRPEIRHHQQLVLAKNLPWAMDDLAFPCTVSSNSTTNRLGDRADMTRGYSTRRSGQTNNDPVQPPPPPPHCRPSMPRFSIFCHPHRSDSHHSIHSMPCSEPTLANLDELTHARPFSPTNPRSFQSSSLSSLRTFQSLSGSSSILSTSHVLISDMPPYPPPQPLQPPPPPQQHSLLLHPNLVTTTTAGGFALLTSKPGIYAVRDHHHHHPSHQNEPLEDTQSCSIYDDTDDRSSESLSAYGDDLYPDHMGKPEWIMSMDRSSHVECSPAKSRSALPIAVALRDLDLTDGASVPWTDVIDTSRSSPGGGGGGGSRAPHKATYTDQLSCRQCSHMKTLHLTGSLYPAHKSVTLPNAKVSRNSMERASLINLPCSCGQGSMDVSSQQTTALTVGSKGGATVVKGKSTSRGDRTSQTTEHNNGPTGGGVVLERLHSRFSRKSRGGSSKQSGGHAMTMFDRKLSFQSTLNDSPPNNVEDLDAAQPLDPRASVEMQTGYCNVAPTHDASKPRRDIAASANNKLSNTSENHHSLGIDPSSSGAESVYVNWDPPNIASHTSTTTSKKTPGIMHQLFHAVCHPNSSSTSTAAPSTGKLLQNPQCRSSSSSLHESGSSGRVKLFMKSQTLRSTCSRKSHSMVTSSHPNTTFSSQMVAQSMPDEDAAVTIGLPVASELPAEVRDPSRNYARVDLRPSPASSGTTELSIGAPVVVVRPARSLPLDPIASTNSSAGSTLGFSNSTSTGSDGTSDATTLTSDTLGSGRMYRSQAPDVLSGLSDCSITSKVTRSTYIGPRRRHSRSLSAAVSEAPVLKYIHVIPSTVPVTSLNDRTRLEMGSTVSDPTGTSAPEHTDSPSSSSGLGGIASHSITPPIPTATTGTGSGTSLGDLFTSRSMTSSATSSGEANPTDAGFQSSSPPPTTVHQQPLESVGGSVDYTQIDLVRTLALGKVNGELGELSTQQSVGGHPTSLGKTTVAAAKKVDRSSSMRKTLSRPMKSIRRNAQKKTTKSDVV